MAPQRRIGDLLVEAGLINNDQLRTTLEQKLTTQKLGNALIERGYLSEHQLVEALQLQLGIPQITLTDYPVDKRVLSLVPKEFAKRNELLPIKTENGSLIVAMADPLDFYAIDDLQLLTGFQVEAGLASLSEINDAIGRLYEGDNSIDDLLHSLDIQPQLSTEDSQTDQADSPAVNLVNQILLGAVEARASDVHLDPQEYGVVIRYRIDGLLRTENTVPKEMLNILITRIKVMGKLNITEKRLPQDGRVKLTLGKRRVDMRISTLPTIFGEKVVIRLLNTQDLLLKIPNLGFIPEQTQLFTKMIEQPTGLILITGPTGSGKTSTLYAALNHLNEETKNIITIEDPIEYQMNGVNQIQTNPGVGLTFAQGLRAILRQDPNIIMVGEIRDADTAEIAIRAALTGHLVFSTLHTNDAATTIFRLIDMGVEPFLVATALSGIVSQRLVRRVCLDCGELKEPTAFERRFFEQASMEVPARLLKRQRMPSVQANRFSWKDGCPRDGGNNR